MPKSWVELDAITSPNVIFEDEYKFRRVVRTPDGHVIKYGESADLAEEVLSMGYAREKLSLPVPRIIAYPGSARKRVPLTFPMPNSAPSGVWYICMEEVPGVALDKVINTLTEEQLDHIAVQLKSYMARISSVKSKTLGSISGGPYRTFLGQIALHQPNQVFTTMSEFYDHFRRLLLMCPGGDLAANRMLSPLPLHSSIHFTHGDLVPKNIMVDGSTITGPLTGLMLVFIPSFGNTVECTLIMT